MTVKVLIRRRVPAGKVVQANELLGQMRMLANSQEGYTAGETLHNFEDPEEVLVISTWETPESWAKWFTSSQRREIQAEVDELLGGRTTYAVYHHGAGG
jgi:heme-degrading monooxygenase HmoA